jgi:hypothetical protein
MLFIVVAEFVFSSCTDFNLKQLANILLIVTTDDVRGRNTDSRELQLENIPDISVAEFVFVKATDFKELHDENILAIPVTDDASGIDTYCNE